MRYSYSNAQMRKADGQTIENGTPSLTLMERAGAALAESLITAAEKLQVNELLLVCGGGNNGGDGFVAARLLLEKGYQVSVLCLAERFSPDCSAVKQRYLGEVTAKIPRRRYRLIADCLFGTGLTRAPEGKDAALISFINSGDYVVSADIPSGLGENGIAYEACVTADETVCMGQLKNCLLLADGADVSGRITVADIGIETDEAGAEVWEDRDAAALFPKKKSNVHKGTFGSACILACGALYSGAAFLAAGACLKSGAGYTRLSVVQPLYSYAIGKLPACVLHEFQAIDGEILRSDAIAVGMGTGVSERLYGLLDELMRSYGGTLVLDADALNSLSLYGTELLRNKSCRVIVTPHPKEFARLTGKTVGQVLSNAVEEASSFAREYGVTVLLKNNRTIITDGARVAINPTGSPALSKGGSGDVLTGFLAGTCARGVPPFEAACVSSYLLGRAGELAAEEMGEYSPDASDIIGYLPRAVRSLS